MKRIKVFTITVISILLVMLVGNFVFAKSAGNKTAKLENGKIYIKYNADVFGTGNSKYKNLYCAEFSQQIATESNYEPLYTIVIEGNQTKIYKGYKETIKDSETPEYTVTNEYSNIIAAALYVDENISLGSKTINNESVNMNHKTYYVAGTGKWAGDKYERTISAGQVALWEYWDNWSWKFNEGNEKAEKQYVKPCDSLTEDTKSIIYRDGTKSKNGVSALEDLLDYKDEAIKLVKEYANSDMYSAKFYYLGTVKKAKDMAQKLVLVESTKTIETSVTVTKNWVYPENQEYEVTNPTISVTLYANGESTGKTKKLKKGNNWTYTFKELKKFDSSGKLIEYAIGEAKLDYYTNTSANQKKMNDGTIAVAVTEKTDGTYECNLENTYTPEKVKFIIEKEWIGNDDKRPKSIIVNFVAKVGNKELSETPITLKEGKWTYTTGELDKYYQGTDTTIDYSFEEVKVVGYNSTVSAPKFVKKEGNVTTYKITITNTLTTSVKVTKEWLDGDNQYNTRDSINVKLWRVKDDKTVVAVNKDADGNKIENPVTLKPDADGNWPTYEWTNLPMYDDNNNIITYAVSESGIDKYKNTTENVYQAKISGTETNVWVTNVSKENDGTYTCILENTLKTSVTVNKKWIDGNNQYNTRDSINVKLWRVKANGTVAAVNEDINGNKIENPVTLELDANGKCPTYKWTNLPMYDDNGKIIYVISETFSTKYTNTTEGKRQVKTENGTEIWVADVETKENGGYAYKCTLENTLKTSVTVKKVWNDDDNRQGKRPNYITVRLWKIDKDNKTGVAVTDAVTLKPDADGNWPTYEWTDLPMYDNKGNIITYAVSESHVGSYKNTTEDKYIITSGTGATVYVADAKKDENHDGYTYTCTLENTYDDVIEIPVKKVWDDSNNQDGVRPDSINVRLYMRKNGEGDDKWTDTKMCLTLNELNEWANTFEGLDIYQDGVLLEYKVVEEEVNKGDLSDYEISAISPGAVTANKIGDGFTVTVTNTHEPQIINIPVEKLWEDNDNRDGIRPESIEVTLYKANSDGTKTKVTNPMILNESNNWTDTFTNLPKYENGQEIDYTIEEVEVSGYIAKTEKVEITGDVKSGFKIVITNTEIIDIPVMKVWEDNRNSNGNRPTSITMKLFAKYSANSNYEEVENVDPLILIGSGTANIWTSKFEDLPKYRNGQEIDYTIEEIEVPGYTGKVEKTGDADSGFQIIITNTRITNEPCDILVTKLWNDYDNSDGIRPESIELTLYKVNSDGTKTKVTKDAEGNTITNPITLSGSGNEWTYTFENLSKKENGQEIDYTIEEIEVPGYTGEVEILGNSESGFQIKITNTHEPEYVGYIEIKGKVWNDGAVGKSNDINGVLDENEKGIEGIKVTLRAADGSQFDATSTAVTDSNGNYTIKVNYDTRENVYKLHQDTNILYDSSKEAIIGELEKAYVEFEYDGMTYTTVATANSGTNTSKAIENETERNSFDASHSTTTVDTKNPDEWTDKNITASTQNVIKSFNDYLKENKGSDTTRTVTLKYCNGDGTYTRTNPEGAWNNVITGNLPANYQDHTGNCSDENHGIMKQYDVDVVVIENVNLGLFEREQPEVAIFSDLSEVEVIMDGQSHIYKYNIVTVNNKNESTVKARFQNGVGSYTYQGAVNPADIIENANSDKELLQVYVTYEVKVGNYGTTLPIIVNSIANVYDSDYTVVSVQKGNSNVNYQLLDSNNKVYDSTDFNEMKLTDLNITVEGGYEASSDDVITIRYKVSEEAIKGLFDEEATLHNGVEILSYTTLYGEKTLYAEQRTNAEVKENEKRTKYGGTDNTSHPGNAEFYVPGEKAIYTDPDSTEYEVQMLKALVLEDDTYIAPSFILHKDDENDNPVYKMLSGNVWEDTDADNGNGSENERLGDGKINGEKAVQNAKVELYKVNTDANGNVSYELANLYKKVNGVVTTIPAVTYTDENGYYSFGSNSADVNERCGVVTDTYVIKFTYGSGIETKINGEIIDARNYKSTIISSENTEVYNYFKNGTANNEWHLNTAKGYSIAVDSIEQRVSIPDLQYSNFDEKYDISTEYSQLFAMQVEFDADGVSEVKADGKTLKEGGTLQNELNVFDFGIIERAREDIFVETTVDYMKLTLSNGSTLADGNPVDGLNNIKAIGLNKKYANGEEAQKGSYKRIIVEMDSEYIQRSQLEVRYVLTVTNNSETDYDYYVDNEYKTEYYYFGTNNENAPKIQSSADYVITYLDADFGEGTWENTDAWTKVTSDQLSVKGNELVNATTIGKIKNGEYIPYATTKFSNLTSGESATEYLTVKKLLANGDENVYDTHAEILKIDAKTARTIDGKDENGTQISKEYKPGNYIPSTMERTINKDISIEKVGLHEQDDDYVMITLTPGTGVTSYIIPYVIAGLIGLIVMVVGVVFIKKKVLTK